MGRAGCSAPRGVAKPGARCSQGPAMTSSELSTEPFDVVVLGGGNAALCAAITAAQAGRRVVVLEGAPEFYRGGNTRHTRNLRCSHDGTAPTMTGPYEQQEFLDDLYRVTGGQTDKVLAEMTIARSRELLPFMDEQGVRFQPPLGGTLEPRQDQRLLPRRRPRHAQRALPPRRGARRRLRLRCAGRSVFASKTVSSSRPRSSMAAANSRCAARRWSPPPAASRPISNG